MRLLSREDELARLAAERRDMSAIATFYLFDKSALESLVNKPVATPQKAGLLKNLFGNREPSPQKLFADEFYTAGKQVAVFEYSGHAFPHLELFLEERFSIGVNSHLEADLTHRLEANVGPCQAFEAAGASGLLRKLSAITISSTDLQAYADDEFGDDQGEMVAALESAFNSLKSWRGQIHTGQIGVLING
ncbi:MAG TPA: hypothetical protein VL866_11360 [Pyrinomonadaceae bacterium]|nr:hypothetical protein [Pyrinomonadaceae bacterium]